MKNTLREEERNKLIISHINLARKMAKRYQAAFLREDIFAAGLEGLVHASKKYDPKKGYKFSTYCRHWIRAKITATLITGRTVSLFRTREGRKLYQNIWKMKSVFEAHGISPSDENIAEYAGITVDSTKEIMRLLDNPEISIDPVNVGESFVPLKDVIPNNSDVHEEIEKTIRDKKVREACEEYLKNVTDVREIAIVREFYLSESVTYEDLGERFDVTKQRMQQIAAKTLKKLKPHLERAGLAA